MDFILFIFSFFSLFSAFLSIKSRNSVYSVLYLILVFINIAALLLYIDIDFLGIILLIIYIGAVAILFLFVVMMLDIKYTKQDLKENLGYIPIILFFLIIFFFEMIIIFSKYFINYKIYYKEILTNLNMFYTIKYINIIDCFENIHTIGHNLYTYYSFYFIIAGLILLVALIGAISLTIKPYNLIIKDLNQFIYKQHSRNKNNSIFNIK